LARKTGKGTKAEPTDSDAPVAPPPPTTPAPEIEDAEVLGETPPALPATPDAATATRTPDAAQQPQPQPETAPQPEPGAERAADPAPETAPDPQPQPEPVVESVESPDPKPQPAPGQASIFPLLAGGLIAAALGFGASHLSQGASPAPDTARQIAALQAEIAALRAAIPDPAPAFDAAPLLDDIVALRAQIADLPRIDLAPLEGRLSDLSAAIASLPALQSAQDALRDELASFTAELAEVRAIAETRVEQAEAAVDTALAQAGLAMVQAAFDTGAPFGPALDQIRAAGFDVPAPLSAIAGTGIPTLEALAEDFPAAARVALRDSLTSAPAASTTERLGNFLRAQVGARSTVARDGDDPDAILSRAGVAVAAGDIDTALSEIATLPEGARTALGDWLSRAQARMDALSALPDLIATVSP
jgi:hypothetical protein